MAKAALLDEIISVSDQLTWVEGPLRLGGKALRPPPVLAVELYDDRLQLLLTSPEYSAVQRLIGGLSQLLFDLGGKSGKLGGDNPFSQFERKSFDQFRLDLILIGGDEGFNTELG